MEDEDSLSHRLEKTQNNGIIDIAVIRFPKISNFSDFDVFSQYSGVSVRYVSKTEQLGNPDLLILPGTKSTIADMQWMRQTGMEQAVTALAQRGFPIFGICGGYQILGAEIADPDKTECGGSVRGLNLLPCQTVFRSNKTQTRTEGKFGAISGFFSCLSHAHFYGYEVHMGVTESAGAALTDCGGAYSGSIGGCYVHGIFDSAEVSGALIRALYSAKGLQYQGAAEDRRTHRDRQLDCLADTVRQSLDIPKIYQIMEEGV